MKHRLIFWLVMYLFGCKDKPYQETLLQEEIQADRPMHNIQGMFEVGTPIAGAAVAAYPFSGLRRGEKMAETTSDDKGVFNLAVKTGHKTYIEFPESMQDTEAPALWGLSKSKESEVINYRRYKNFYIIDHLIDLAELLVDAEGDLKVGIERESVS